MEYNRRMIETSKLKSLGRIPSFKLNFNYFRKFPLISTLEQVHQHNMHVAKICRQNTMQSLHVYLDTKEKYQKQTLPNQKYHINNARSIEEDKRKKLEEKNRSAKKKNSENIDKLMKVFGQRREEMTKKQMKMMERSLVKRQDYMKSLNQSIHHSQDKLYKIRQREQNEMNMSQTLFGSYLEKVEIANQRKEEYIEWLRQSLKEKNIKIDTTYQFSLQKDKKKEDVYINRLVSKFEKSQLCQSQNVTKLAELIEEKRKDQAKLKEKHLKKRRMLQETRDRLLEEEHEKSEMKREKAIEHKRGLLSTITNTLTLKRKSKEKNLFSATMTNMRQQEVRIQDLNEKYRQTTSLWQAYKEQKERLHSQHLADSYIASHLE